MGTLETAVDHRTKSYLEERAAMLDALASLETALDSAREAGGERAVTRHHARGKLLARERIELLVDRDSPLLELGAVAGWGTGAPIGGGVVTAIGVVEGQACMIVADDPTVAASADSDPASGHTRPAGYPAVPARAGTLRKIRRAQQIARENRLPLVDLAEAGTPEAGTGGPDQSLPEGAALELFHQLGQVVAGFSRLAAAGVPTVVVLFGEPPVESAGAGPFDYTIALRSAPGLASPARPGDDLAEDERDALRLARQCARRFPQPGCSRMARPAGFPEPPKYDPEDLLAIPGGDPWEILGRVLDASVLDEVQPGYGAALCAGWGEVHGHPVAVLAYTRNAAREEEADKATRLVQLAGRAGTPLLLLRQGSTPVAGDEAALAGAVAAAGVPLVTVRVGGWSGVPAVPALARFRFAWPDTPVRTAATAVPALGLAGRLDDDGVIDPRDTRTVLGACLSVTRSGGEP